MDVTRGLLSARVRKRSGKKVATLCLHHFLIAAGLPFQLHPSKTISQYLLSDILKQLKIKRRGFSSVLKKEIDNFCVNNGTFTHNRLDAE